jgi:hypothetical protein
MTRREKFAAALLKPINTAAIVLLGGYTILWGIWVGNPFWTVFTQAKLYSVLSGVAPEYFWGALAIVVGTMTVFGAVKRSYRSLVIGASVVGWHWFMIAIFYLMGDWHNTGGSTSMTFAVYAAYIYLNIKVNHGKNAWKKHWWFR